MMRPVSLFGVVSCLRRSCGYSGVSLANCGRLAASSTLMPLMVSTDCSGTNFWRWLRRSPSRGARMDPVTASPLRRPYFLT